MPRKKPRSCGVLLVRGEPVSEFLLMKHPTRWDLPKGHIDPGESDLECALREMNEETGIDPAQVDIDDRFAWEHHYMVDGSRYGTDPVEKSLLIFLGRVGNDVDVAVSEHSDFRWFTWNPPHAIQAKTIDPLLAAVAEFLESNP